jgi:hypothetical protein
MAQPHVLLLEDGLYTGDSNATLCHPHRHRHLGGVDHVDCSGHAGSASNCSNCSGGRFSTAGLTIVRADGLQGVLADVRPTGGGLLQILGPDGTTPRVQVASGGAAAGQQIQAGPGGAGVNVYNANGIQVGRIGVGAGDRRMCRCNSPMPRETSATVRASTRTATPESSYWMPKVRCRGARREHPLAKAERATERRFEQGR